LADPSATCTTLTETFLAFGTIPDILGFFGLGVATSLLDERIISADGFAPRKEHRTFLALHDMQAFPVPGTHSRPRRAQ
jgi:hypothetical protein